MSEAVARQTALRMREHLLRHGRPTATVSFHGGEPLLGGVRHLEMLCGVLDQVFAGTGIELSLILQSNGLLFTPEIGDFLLRHGIKMGVSVDGPPEVNDQYRVDHRGRPTSSRLEKKLHLLLTRYADAFAGLLCVIDLAADPVEVIQYLLSFGPRSLSLLFPLNNHERRPRGKEGDLAATPYGDWLIASFDVWWNHAASVRVAIFDSILSLLCGGRTYTEAIGLTPVALVAVETNGELEAVDSLKSTFEGATQLGFNVFEHDFDTVARDPAVQQRQIGLAALCRECRECPVVEVCGGGYLPHRYSPENGFANPSIYSSDLKKLIRHIHGVLHQTLEREQVQAVTV
jgi:uncharacterized protein